jgi:hypothetical protein
MIGADTIDVLKEFFMRHKKSYAFAIGLSILLSYSISFGQAEIVKDESEFPAAVLPVHSYEFEAVPDGVEVRHEFVIQNKGAAPLFISRVKTG